jgi:hypothetical protein
MRNSVKPSPGEGFQRRRKRRGRLLADHVGIVEVAGDVAVVAQGAQLFEY